VLALRSEASKSRCAPPGRPLGPTHTVNLRYEARMGTIAV